MTKLIIEDFEKLSDDDKKELQDLVSGITSKWKIIDTIDELQKYTIRGMKAMQRFQVVHVNHDEKEILVKQEKLRCR